MSYENTRQNVLNVGYDKNNIYVFIQGEATMLVAGTLKKFVLDIISQIANQSDTNIYLILKDCGYMDSTFIGTLVIVEKRCVENLNRHILLSNPSNYCLELFEQMGLLKVFTIITELPVKKDLNVDPLEMTEIDRLENAILMFQAHEELSGINDENKERFSLVSKTLKDQIQKELKK